MKFTPGNSSHLTCHLSGQSSLPKLLTLLLKRPSMGNIKPYIPESWLFSPSSYANQHLLTLPSVPYSGQKNIEPLITVHSLSSTMAPFRSAISLLTLPETLQEILNCIQKSAQLFPHSQRWGAPFPPNICTVLQTTFAKG